MNTRLAKLGRAAPVHGLIVSATFVILCLIIATANAWAWNTRQPAGGLYTTSESQILPAPLPEPVQPPGIIQAPHAIQGDALQELHVQKGCAPSCGYGSIKYKYGKRVRKNGSGPPLTIELTVQDPCYCDCAVRIPVCMPACCTDVPSVTSRGGAAGKGVVKYRWSCGYRVIIVFRRSGDILVIGV